MLYFPYVVQTHYAKHVLGWPGQTRQKLRWALCVISPSGPAERCLILPKVTLH